MCCGLIREERKSANIGRGRTLVRRRKRNQFQERELPECLKPAKKENLPNRSGVKKGGWKGGGTQEEGPEGRKGEKGLGHCEKKKASDPRMECLRSRVRRAIFQRT